MASVDWSGMMGWMFGRRRNRSLYIIATAMLIVACTYALQLGYRARTVSLPGAVIEHGSLFTVGKLTPSGDWFSLGRDEVEFLSSVVSASDGGERIALAPYKSTSVPVRLPDGAEMEVGVAYVSDETLRMISPISSRSGAPIKNIAPGTAVVAGGWRADLVSGVLFGGPDAYPLRVVNRTEFAGIFGERPQLLVHWDDAYALSNLGRNAEQRAPFYSVIAAGPLGRAHLDRLQPLLENFLTQTANDAIAKGEAVMMRTEPDARLHALAGIHSSRHAKDRHDRIVLLVLFAAGALMFSGMIVISFVSARETQLARHDVALKAALGATGRHLVVEHAGRIALRFAVAAVIALGTYAASASILGDVSGLGIGSEPVALGIALALALLWIAVLEALAMLRQVRGGNVKAIIASHRASSPGALKHLGVTTLVFMAMVGVAMGVFVHTSLVAEMSRMLLGVRPEVGVAELELNGEASLRRRFAVVNAMSASTAGGSGQVLWTTQLPGERDRLRAEVLFKAIPGEHGPNAFVVAGSAAALDRLGAQVIYGDATFRGRRDVLLSQSLAARLGVGVDGLGTTLYLHLSGLPAGFGMPAEVAGIVSDVHYSSAADGAMAIYLAGDSGVQMPGLSNIKFLWSSAPTRTQVQALENDLIAAGLDARLNYVGSVADIAARSMSDMHSLRSGLLVIAGFVLASAVAAALIAVLTSIGDMRRDIAIRSAVGGSVTQITLQLATPLVLWSLIPAAAAAVVVTQLVISRFYAAAYEQSGNAVVGYASVTTLVIAMAMVIAIAAVARRQVAQLNLSRILGEY